MSIPHSKCSRRAVLGSLVAAPFVWRPAGAAGRARKLNLRHLHTRETLAVTYWEDGQYNRKALLEVDQFMRDWRTGEVFRMDPGNLDTIYSACLRLGVRPTLDVISGYRTVKTNEMLRRRSTGVARNSYHLTGQAIDFRLVDRSVRQTHKALLAYQRGGVGLYTRSNFIHVDTGPIRDWGS